MARVQLYLLPPRGNPTFRFVRAGGRRDSIPALWLRAYVDLRVQIRPGQQDTDAAFPRCIIDTGAHLAVIPEYIWAQFKPGVVTPLPFDPTMPAGQRVLTFAGGTWAYGLGELTIRPRDLVGGVLDATVVAQLTRDGGKLTTPMVLGLRGGFLDQRILRAEPDATAAHGQAWVLEDPAPAAG